MLHPPFLKTLQVCAVLTATACATPPLPESIAPDDSHLIVEAAPVLVLGTNDLLHVVIPGHPELNSERGFSVSVAGAVILPLCGPVQVAGLSLEQAEEQIHDALAEYLVEPSVGLSIIERHSQKIYLLGQVKQPGTMVLQGPTTVLEALAHAGGFEFGARRDRVALIRRLHDGGCDVFFFSGESPGAQSQRWVHSGDVLFIPRSGVGVFRDEVLPILQGIGFATSQLTAVAIAADQF